MVVAEFKGNETTKYVGDVYQYDLGQVLCIKGLNLPKFVEIDFTLQETGSTTESEVGITRNGVTEVEIPNHMLINNDTNANYMIYAFVYLTDETSGETIRKIRISVKARSKPENFTAPEDTKLFQEAIKTVNESAERAESAEQKAAEHAEQTKTDVQKTTADRQEVEKLVDSVSGIGEQVQAVKDYKEQAQTAATNALLSEQKSEQAKEAALRAQAGAETAEGKAEQHALDTAGDKTEVERLATQVRQDKSSVEQTAQGFGNTVQQAEQSINTAKTKAVEAVQTEGTKQTGKVTAEGEKQVQAVQAKGQEVINSIPQDFQTQMTTKVDKQQGTENAGKLLGVGTDGNVTLMGGARVGEVLIADYTHRGNPEFHFSDFDFATGIGTTTEPHGLTKKTEVLICPNDWTSLNPFKNMINIPIEWTMVSASIGLLPVDDTHLKVVKFTEEAIIDVNLEDISNKSVDITKFHFEIPISYVIKNLDSMIESRYIKVLQNGYCSYCGKYRYRNVGALFESGKVANVKYIDILGFAKGGNSPSKNGIFMSSELLIDLRVNTNYREKSTVYSRRKGYSHLVNDAYNLLNDTWIQSQSENIKAIRSYSTHADAYAYMSNGTRIQIYALEGEYKNES